MPDRTRANKTPGTTTARPLRLGLFGLVFFVMPLNAYLDPIGWAFFLGAARHLEDGDRAPRRLAVLGLVVSAARTATLLPVGHPPAWLYGGAALASLALAAAFLWQLCGRLARAAENAGEDRLRRRALLRRRLYAAYPALPFAGTFLIPLLPQGAPRLVAGGLLLLLGAGVTMLVMGVLARGARTLAVVSGPGPGAGEEQPEPA